MYVALYRLINKVFFELLYIHFNVLVRLEFLLVGKYAINVAGIDILDRCTDMVSIICQTSIVSVDDYCEN